MLRLWGIDMNIYPVTVIYTNIYKQFFYIYIYEIKMSKSNIVALKKRNKLLYLVLCIFKLYIIFKCILSKELYLELCTEKTSPKNVTRISPTKSGFRDE